MSLTSVFIINGLTKFIYHASALQNKRNFTCISMTHQETFLKHHSIMTYLSI